MQQTRNSLIPVKLLSFNFYATNALVVAFLPIYLQYKELTGSQIGLVLAAGPFASIISQPLWGYLSDKYKTVKWIILICLIGFLFTSFIFFRMDMYLYILIMALFVFFFAQPVGALTDSLSQRLALDMNVSFGGIRVWGSIGFALASSISGFILYEIGINNIFILLSPLICILILIVFFLPDVKYDSSNQVGSKDFIQVITNKRFIVFLLFAMFISVTQRGNDTFIALYISELGGFESQVGLAWSMALVGEAIVFSLSYLWFKRFHPIQLIIIAAVFYTIRWYSYSLISGPNSLLTLQLLNGPSFAVFYLASFAYVSSILPKNVQSTGHLLFVTMFFGIAGVFSALIGGNIIENMGGATLYYFMSYSSGIGIILFIIYYIVFIKRENNKVTM